MNYRNYLKGLSFTTLVFGGALMFLSIFLSPQNGFGTILSYYIAAFFFILGVAAIFGFYFRRWWSHNEVIFTNVKISIRQAFLLALFVSVLLLLSSLRLLNIWDGVILAISFFLVELYFKSRNYDEL